MLQLIFFFFFNLIELELTCPGNIRSLSTNVTWPNPIASNYVVVLQYTFNSTEIYPEIGDTNTSYSRFEQGSTNLVKIVAMDGAGSNATCEFHVYIEQGMARSQLLSPFMKSVITVW